MKPIYWILIGVGFLILIGLIIWLLQGKSSSSSSGSNSTETGSGSNTTNTEPRPWTFLTNKPWLADKCIKEGGTVKPSIMPGVSVCH